MSISVQELRWNPLMVFSAGRILTENKEACRKLAREYIEIMFKAMLTGETELPEQTFALFSNDDFYFKILKEEFSAHGLDELYEMGEPSGFGSARIVKAKKKRL